MHKRESYKLKQAEELEKTANEVQSGEPETP
jgi:hypothetical protein